MCRVDRARYRPAVSASTIRQAADGPVVAEELPGFIPRVLRLDDVSLLRADETVFNDPGARFCVELSTWPTS